MTGSQPLTAASVPLVRDAGRVAVFDVDRTLLPGSSLVALGRALAGRKLLSRRRLLMGLARDASFRRRGATDQEAERLCTAALRQVAGVESQVLLSLVDEVADDLSKEIRPGMRLVLQRHLEAGDFVVLLSASPQELVEGLATRVRAHRAIGTRACVIDGRYTGELLGAFCYGPGKLTRIHEDLGPDALRGAIAYADSASDLPVLEACEEPVAVNPDRQLLGVARERRWPVVRFG